MDESWYSLFYSHLPTSLFYICIIIAIHYGSLCLSRSLSLFRIHFFLFPLFLLLFRASGHSVCMQVSVAESLGAPFMVPFPPEDTPFPSGR